MSYVLLRGNALYLYNIKYIYLFYLILSLSDNIAGFVRKYSITLY